jgi:hypothetical protein
MDDRDWARLEARLTLLEATLGLRPDADDVEREADLILAGRLLGWRPGMAMPVRRAGLPDGTARWLAGAIGENIGESTGGGIGESTGEGDTGPGPA